MNLYTKIANRMREAEQKKRKHPSFDPNTEEQYRFNDQIPMQFGGFGPFLNPSLMNLPEFEGEFDGDMLMSQLIRSTFIHSMGKRQTPLALNTFLQTLSNNTSAGNLSQILEGISNNIQTYFEQCLVALKQKSDRFGRIKEEEEEQIKKEENPYIELFGNLKKEEEISEQQEEQYSQRGKQKAVQAKQQSLERRSFAFPKVYGKKRIPSFEEQATNSIVKKEYNKGQEHSKRSSSSSLDSSMSVPSKKNLKIKKKKYTTKKRKKHHKQEKKHKKHHRKHHSKHSSKRKHKRKY